MCLPTSSGSMEEATTSIETLSDLVHQVLKSNQELSTRLSGLEGLLQAQTVASSHSTNQPDDEDDVSTIIPRRSFHTSLSEKAAVMNARSIFAFDDDLYSSRVYVRALRRKSFRSLYSDSKSFGWSCLSALSMADVSNISVVSLPICGAELKNSEHYGLTKAPEHRGSRSLQPQPDLTAQQGFQPPTAVLIAASKCQSLHQAVTSKANICLWGG